MAGESKEGNSFTTQEREIDMNSAKMSSLPSLPDDNDLEKYGVWVKSGPEDVLEDDIDTEDFELQDLDSEKFSTGPSLTDEEEELLGKLEDEIPEEEDIFSDSGAEPALEDSLPSLGDEDFTIDEDFSLGGESLSAESENLSTTDEEFNIPEEDDLNIELMQNLDGEEFSLDGEISEDISLDEKLTEDGSAEMMLDDEELIEIPLEEELEDFEDSEPGELGADSLEIESIDDNTGEIPAAIIPSAEEDLDNIDIDDLHQSDYGEELPELELETDDELLFRDETAAGEQENGKRDEKVLKMDASTSILLKIEAELKSIKSELASLKNELSTLRSFEPQDKEKSPEEKDKLEPAGFFEEEEDETIALTGDELDNILNTAEITEEAGAAEFLEDETLTDDELDNILNTADIIDESEELEDSGFLADETLTGDELDNILNTAELTVETAESDLSPDDMLNDDIIPLDEVSSSPASRPAEEELSLDDLPSFSLDEELVIPEDLELMTGEDGTELEALPDISDAEDVAAPQKSPAPPRKEETKSLKENQLIDEIEIDVPEEDFIEGEVEPAEEITLEEDVLTDEAVTLEDDDFLGDLSLEDEDQVELLPDDSDLDSLPEISLEDEQPDHPRKEILMDIPLETETEDLDLGLEMEPELSLEDIEIEDEEFDIIAEHEEAISDADIESLKKEQLDEDLGFEPEIEPVLDEGTADEIELEEPVAAEAEMDEILLEEPVSEAEDAADFAEPLSEEPVMENIPDDLKQDLKKVLTYMDQLLESLPEDKIKEFAESEHFEIYRKLFDELGLT